MLKLSVQINLAFLLSSARLATSLRLISQAERNLKRDEEAEQTLVAALQIFKAPHLTSCLQSMYAESDKNMDSGEASS